MKTILAALLALALCAPALADKTGRIRVLGRAQEERVPDFASVTIGVESRNATPTAFLDTASKAAGRIIASAKTLGVPDADIATSSVTLQPAFKDIRQPDGIVRQQPDGYTAGNRITVRLSDMGKLGELMRTALDGGANRIDSLSFGLRDPNAAEAAVQVAAMKDARAQAERLADAAGVKVGAALAITSPPRSEAPSPPPFQAMLRSPSPRGKSVPIEAGSIALSAEVDAVFAIER